MTNKTGFAAVGLFSFGLGMVILFLSIGTQVDLSFNRSTLVVQASQVTSPIEGTDELERQLFINTNSLRLASGLSSLTLDESLVNLSRARSQDMASKSYFAHTSPSGETVFTMLDRFRIGYSIAGENIARNNYGQPAKVAFEGLVDSPTHLENMLDPRFTNIGIGVATGSDGLVYFTQLFLTP